jgi:protocadherin-15
MRKMLNLYFTPQFSLLRALFLRDKYIYRSILDKNATDSIKVVVSGTLHATASEIHPPLTPPSKVVHAAAAPTSLDVFPIAIIIIACIVLVLGIVGIIYICISWSRLVYKIAYNI